jgi:hypothetical protein
MDASGVSEGSIIAAIMSVHTPTNPVRPRPIVPGITPICRAMASVTSQAPAAATRTMTAGNPRRRSARKAMLMPAHRPQAPPVTGSMTALTSEMRLTGKPPQRACSSINAGELAVWTQ